MANRSIFSILKGKLSSSDATTFIQLSRNLEDSSAEDVDNLSKIDFKQPDNWSPGIHIQKDIRPQIPLIGIGGAGVRLTELILKRVKSYGMNYPVMGIDTDKKSLESVNTFEIKTHIKGSDVGTSHQFLKGQSRTKKMKEELLEDVKKYLSSMELRIDHEIVFLLLGSGGTGIGCGIELAKYLIELGKRPVPIMILPDRSEMTRIKFNAAVGLYKFSYAPVDRGMNLVTICIDNNLFIEKNGRENIVSVINAANERIASTLGDIIASTTLESHAYSSDLNEFFEIFRDIKGIGALHYIQTENNRTISEVYEKAYQTSFSLDIEPSKATRAYFYISSNTGNVLAKDYRDLLVQFQSSDVFHKLYEVDREEPFVALRGIFTGISYSDYLEEIMRLAESARIELLEKEKDRKKKGNVNPKIDRLEGDQEIEVDMNTKKGK